MPSIELYAELLPSIRKVAFSATLKTEHTKETKAELSADGEIITLSHEGEEASIRLPTQISGGGTAALTLPSSPAKELTLRLQLEEKSPGFLKINYGLENVVPWSANSLSRSTRISCRECGNEIVKPGSITTWKDLPNENWAELMDFWHCHKPDGHAHDDTVSNDKGYAASNRFTAASGTGFVDLLYFVVAEQDCSGVKPEEVADNTMFPQQLSCSSCDAVIGAVDERADGWRLYKWAVVIADSNSTKSRYSLQKWISAQLLGVVENQNIRRFIVYDRQNSRDKYGLMLWIFTTDLAFSSSRMRDKRNDPTRAMKVYWQNVPNPREISEKQSSSVEELLLPASLHNALNQALKTSTLLLPASARKYQDWNVGLLERFQGSEV